MAKFINLTANLFHLEAVKEILFWLVNVRRAATISREGLIRRNGRDWVIQSLGAFVASENRDIWLQCAQNHDRQRGFVVFDGVSSNNP